MWRSALRALESVVEEVRHEDPFQRDPATVARIAALAEVMRLYFNPEVRGFENLPAQGPLLVVGNHSGGLETVDFWPLFIEWVRRRGPEVPLYALAYDLNFAYPVVGALIRKLGMLPASQENARRALAQGATVVVFPGGDYEVFRPWSHRNEIEFGGHHGFVELALSTGAPVVPMTIHGAHQSTFVLTRGRRIAEVVGLRRAHVQVFPFVWNVPFGITPGFVPSVQLPSKITVQIGAPLDWSHFGSERAHDPDVVAACYDEVTGVMQRTLAALAAERPYPVLTRLNELRPSQIAARWLRARRRGDAERS